MSKAEFKAPAPNRLVGLVYGVYPFFQSAIRGAAGAFQTLVRGMSKFTGWDVRPSFRGMASRSS